MTTALVIGAGPAGLMAAQTLAAEGVQVTVAEKMPSVGRKFLMAGKSGLNITNVKERAAFQSVYHPGDAALLSALQDFGSDEVQDWARDLGQDIFTGSTGRVFPKVMKASPLLRAWLARLATLNVTINTRWLWTGWDGSAVTFSTPNGPQSLSPDVTILALGGASWARLGSDGAWTAHIHDTAPFQPANMGFRRVWSKHMAPFLGQPVKNIGLAAGPLRSRGEIILSQGGLEGGGIYEVSRAMREGAPLTLDLVPDLTLDMVNDRWAQKPRKATLSRFLKNGLKLSPIKIALFHEITQNAQPATSEDWSKIIKALPISHDGPHNMDQAISTAGGVRFGQLTNDWMLVDHPGTFCAGEMLDWEAPTGGYLITGSLATGRAAALGALEWANNRFPQN